MVSKDKYNHEHVRNAYYKLLSDRSNRRLRTTYQMACEEIGVSLATLKRILKEGENV